MISFICRFYHDLPPEKPCDIAFTHQSLSTSKLKKIQKMAGIMIRSINTLYVPRGLGGDINFLHSV